MLTLLEVVVAQVLADLFSLGIQFGSLFVST